MDYESLLKQRPNAQRAEGRYRVFADLEPRCGQFPRADDHLIGARLPSGARATISGGGGQQIN